MEPNIIEDRRVFLPFGHGEHGFLDEEGMEWVLHSEESSVTKLKYNFVGNHVHLFITCSDNSQGEFFTDRRIWNKLTKLDKVDWIKEGF